MNCVALPLPAPPPMLYPQAGAVGVPDGNFVLVLAFAYGTSTSLVSASATIGPLAATAVPSPLPSGAGTPLPGASPVAYSVPALGPGTKYTVTALFTRSGCPDEPSDAGSFVTR